MSIEAFSQKNYALHLKQNKVVPIDIRQSWPNKSKGLLSKHSLSVW